MGNKTKTKQKLETEAGNIQGGSEKILETFYAKNTDEQLGNAKMFTKVIVHTVNDLTNHY